MAPTHEGIPGCNCRYFALLRRLRYILKPTLLKSVEGFDSDRRTLRSSGRCLCTVPRCSKFGQRSFCVAGPHLWNDLLKDLRKTGLLIGTFGKHLKTLLFLQRVGIACYASAVYATAVSDRPSVCPSSVTFRCFVETNEATIMRFSPSDSKIILVSGELKVVWKFAGDHP